MSINQPDNDAAAAQFTYRVEGMSCGHCKSAIEQQVGAVAGVESVQVDLDGKLVRIEGSRLEDEALRAAIDEAGYDAVIA